MYVSKLSSGGRGEYELAEPYGNLTPVDFVDAPIHFRLADLGNVDSQVVLRFDEDQGKYRLRLIGNSGIHLVRQIAAACLLPKPIRDEGKLPGGQPTVVEGRFICRRAYFTSAAVEDGHATVEIGTLHLYNGSQVEDVDFSSRIQRVREVHAQSHLLTSNIAAALQSHESSIEGGGPVGLSAERATKAVMRAVADSASDYNVDYVAGADVLDTLTALLSIPRPEEPASVEDIPPSDFELRRREISKWRRWAAYRGAESAKFRRQVRDAYDSTCIVSGVRLPKSEFCRVPGVDSAHILPWATHEMDEVCNGICLNKHFHWAFDQGSNTYTLRP